MAALSSTLSMLLLVAALAALATSAVASPSLEAQRLRQRLGIPAPYDDALMAGVPHVIADCGARAAAPDFNTRPAADPMDPVCRHDTVRGLADRHPSAVAARDQGHPIRADVLARPRRQVEQLIPRSRTR